MSFRKIKNPGFLKSKRAAVEKELDELRVILFNRAQEKTNTNYLIAIDTSKVKKEKHQRDLVSIQVSIKNISKKISRLEKKLLNLDKY